MTNFDDFKLAVEGLSGGNNTVKLDDLGMPSIVVPFPKLKYSDVIEGATQDTHPAFILDGQEKDVLYMSKYQNIIVNDRAYSLPMKDPSVYVNFDRALTVCRNKGTGWHLTTNAFWAAVALWCKKNGTMPHGNNDFGQDKTNTWEKGVPTSKGSDERVNRIATGSGPATWYHNYNLSGIADLNGNVWEWVSGLRLVDGEIQIIPYGNAMKAESNMSDTSTEWKAILADGTFVTPGTADTLKWGAYSNTPFANVATTPAATGGATLLEALGLIPHEGATAADYGNGAVWSNLSGERLPLRGGNWNDGLGAGVFALRLNSPRSHVSAHVGFRAAFYE